MEKAENILFHCQLFHYEPKPEEMSYQNEKIWMPIRLALYTGPTRILCPRWSGYHSKRRPGLCHQPPKRVQSRGVFPHLSRASTSTGISTSSQISNNISIKLSLSSSLLQITCREVDPSLSATFGLASDLSSNSTARFGSSATVKRGNVRSDASWGSGYISSRISWSQ
ncbi:unnamed protein product [Trichogramma brassicae]|uniref:Uncharacterized protein n=1 Tax=Trichogramma brassicae TaxID=86971 RepID=A0A6H5J2A2_9HYME|nr:unnamed protein product [Trichogramma brassicae]